MEPLHTLATATASKSTTPAQLYTCSELTYLELRPSIRIEGTVVVQDVHELELMAHADVIIVQIVGRRDLHRAGTEGHVDDDVVRDDGDAAVEERVLGELAVEVLVSRVVWVHGDGSIA